MPAGRYGDHQHISLTNFFGSHSLKRKKPEGEDAGGAEALARMGWSARPAASSAAGTRGQQSATRGAARGGVGYGTGAAAGTVAGDHAYLGVEGQPDPHPGSPSGSRSTTLRCSRLQMRIP